MVFVIYKRQEGEVLKQCGVKDICQIGVPTLKLIQAARTKVFYKQESLDSTVERPTRIARLRLERKKKRKPTRIHSEVVGTKNLLTGITFRNVVRTKNND